MATESLVNDQVITDRYAIYNGDCVPIIEALPESSVDFCIYSPPFSSLYTYSASERDLGNSTSDEEFWMHYRFVIAEVFRCLKPGRLTSVHCMNLPSSKERDGIIGLKDFRGDIIRAHEDAGFVYHSEVCIWKDPVTAMQRTKAIGLLHKQIVKDSCMSRQGIPDYLVTFRKPGVNPDPVEGEFVEFVGDDSALPSNEVLKGQWEQQKKTGSTMSFETFKSINIWQRYASPVWMDINPSDTLQRESAREEKDERHVCPLQLQVIHRALQMWTNPGDIVLTPFLGIGSELFESLKMGRRGIGAELKRSYFCQAVRNLESAVTQAGQQSMFDEME